MTRTPSVPARAGAFLLLYLLSGLPMIPSKLLGWPRWETVPGTIAWLLLVPVFFIGARWISRQMRMDDLGLGRQPGWGRQLLGGFALGMGLVVLVLLMAIGTGTVKLTGFDATGLAPLRLLAIGLNFLYVALSEEIVFRAFLTKLLPTSLARIWVTLIVTALFTAAHLVQGVPNAAVLCFIFLFGLLAMLPYLRTGRLWLSIGLHWAYDSFNLLLLDQDQVLVKQWISGWHLWLYSAAVLMVLVTLYFLLPPQPQERQSGQRAA